MQVNRFVRHVAPCVARCSLKGARTVTSATKISVGLPLPLAARNAEIQRSSTVAEFANRVSFDPTTRSLIAVRRLAFAARTSLICLAVWLSFAAPPPARGDYGEAIELYRTGKYAECIESTEEGIAEGGANENLWTLKIRAELALGRYQAAEKSLSEGLKQLPASLDLRWLGREVCRYNNQPDRVKQLEGEIPQLVQQVPQRYSDALNRVVIARFLLSQGADPKKVLGGLVNVVKKQNPNFVPAYLASGDLALDKGDFALAAEAFEQAIRIFPGDPDAHFGLAQAFAPSGATRAEQALKAALNLNPRHVPSLLMIVDELIDSEHYEQAEQVLNDVEGVNLRHPLAAAYRAVLAHLRNEPGDEERYRKAALHNWRTNPGVDYLIGKKLSQKYRFAEGAKYQRQALGHDPGFLPAKMQLSQDLLRLGQEEEGWRLADEVSRADGYNVVAHNLMTLQESLARFHTIEEDGIVARMDAREADIYGHRVLDLLHRAKRELCARYEVTIEQPVIVEMFPRQQDFAIRTFGLPGGAGFLGVCFGTVITANSPAAHGSHPTCWEATLWHEFCHVVTLNKTQNKMPRWLSEGISVYEERQADPAWGQSLNPQFRQMLLKDDLTPVSGLSAAFLRPPSPQHLQFAYFESSLVVQFLVERYGLDTLRAILVDLGNGMTINDSLTRQTGAIEELDAAFAEYARSQAEGMAPAADWSDPDLPARSDAGTIANWLAARPDNYFALKRLAQQLIADKEWQAAREPLDQMQRLYARDAAADGVYVLLARVARELKEIPQERKALETLAVIAADNVDMFARLTELTAQAGDWEATRKYALRWLAVNPLDPGPHRRAAEAAGHLHDLPLAIASYRALLELDPVDPAEIHVRLATVLQQAGELTAARRHALLALEETPRFRAAQRRLLDIVGEIERREPSTSAENP
jgi:tetratricopeptide (TPR) repeat protein